MAMRAIALADALKDKQHGRILREFDFMRWNPGRTHAARLLTLFGLLASSAVAAQPIFKCLDAQGEIAFQDTRCAPGQAEQAISIRPAPPPPPSADASPVADTRAPRAPPRRRARAAAPEMSFECRTSGGAVFYRHGGCPHTIAKESSRTDLHASRGETVQARRIPRAEACRALRSVGRRGREYDDVTPTYEKNLGHDPCRRY